MPAPAFTTWLEATNLTLQSVGHPVTADIPSSPDEAVLRCGFYVNQICNEILYGMDWEDLTKFATLNIVQDFPNQTEKGFDLPADFADFVDDTQWNASNQMPAIGPVSPQDWQWLVVRQAQITTRFMWRLRGGQLWIKSPPAVSQPFTYEYISKNWARDASDTPKELMTLNNDYHIFPWNLVVLGARKKWLENEGYDSVVAASDYQRAWEFYSGSDKGATALSLVPGVGYPYINAVRNLPPTGFGS